MSAKRRPHKKIRLPIEAYGVPGTTWHVTICTVEREPYFANCDHAAEIRDQILWYAERYGLTAHAWVVMPDHTHLLSQVNTKNLILALGAFKSYTTKLWWARGGSGSLWQESLYDHGVRQIDDFDRAVTYLIDNPRRLGLVKDAFVSPFLGGDAITPKHSKRSADPRGRRYASSRP